MSEYIEMAMEKATYERLEDGTWYAAIPGFKGVWADGDAESEAREELREVLQGWIEFRASRDLEIPKVGSIDVKQLV